MILHFYKPVTIFEKLICWWTKGPYCHVEIKIDNIFYWSDMAQGGVGYTQNRYSDSRPYDAYTLSGYDPILTRLWFENHLGEKYDFLGLLGFVFPWKIENKNRWFCSEVIAASLGIKKSHTYSPTSLFSYLTKFGRLKKNYKLIR